MLYPPSSESDVPGQATEPALVEMVERVRQAHDACLCILGGDTKALLGRDIKAFFSGSAMVVHRVVSYEPTKSLVTAPAGARVSDLEALLA